MSIEQTSLEDFGYQFLGPICTHYFQALEGMLKNKQSSKLLFLAREGYFFRKAYSALVERNLIQSAPFDYLFASRTFLFRISIADEETWPLSLGNKFTGSLKKLLVSRFGFSSEVLQDLFDEIQLETTYELPADIDDVSALLQANLDALRALVTRSRSDYIDYLRQLDLSSFERLVMVDVGYSGTIQKLLTRLLSIDTHGLYFITTAQGTVKAGNGMATFVPVFKDDVKMGDGYYMLDRSLFLESLLTAPNGQFIDIKKSYLPHDGSQDFDDDIDQQYHFFYGRHSYAQDHFMALEALFNGAVQAIVENFHHGVIYSVDEIETLFERYTKSRSTIPSAVWPLFELDDAISGNANVSPMQLFKI